MQLGRKWNTKEIQDFDGPLEGQHALKRYVYEWTNGAEGKELGYAIFKFF